MNEFKFYGEENTENDDAVQLREQQAEKEAEKERNSERPGGTWEETFER